MRYRHLWMMMTCAALALSACAPAGQVDSPGALAAAEESDACPVTQPPEPPFTPPGSLAPLEDGAFWFGTPALWTMLHVDATWHDLPLNKDGYTQKILFWREGYDPQAEPQPALLVTARRLDGDAPSLESTMATNGSHPDLGSFMLTGLDFPTTGCWEVTGQYGEQSLSYVVRIDP
jgi:hypothetical protein